MPKIHIIDTEGRWKPGSEDEHLWWPRVLWIDPGVVSGVAVIWFDPKALLEEGKTLPKVLLAYSEMYLGGPENGVNGQVNRFMRMHRDLNRETGLATGCESFTILQYNQEKDFLSPVRIRAGIEARLSVTRPPHADPLPSNGIPLFIQSPSDAKSTFTDERLRNLRMYTPGPDHVNDAKRHGLLHIRRIKGEVQKNGLAAFEDAHGHEEGWFE
jgi:hypothetical protein